MCPVCQHSAVEYNIDEIKCIACDGYIKSTKWYQRPYIWAREKSWWWRLIILIWMLYVFARYVKDPDYPMHRMSNIFNAIDFGVHELGHFIFIPFGQFMTILGGSLFQTIFPLLWLGALFWKRWYFAASLCFIWVGLNMYDVATYAADARARVLPLATLASDYDEAHDWYQILSRTGKLESDLSIAHAMRFCGFVFVIIGTVLAISLLVAMILFRNNKSSLPKEPEDTSPKEQGQPPSSLYPTPNRN